jgi:hypothetical protein
MDPERTNTKVPEVIALIKFAQIRHYARVCCSELTVTFQQTGRWRNCRPKFYIGLPQVGFNGLIRLPTGS